MGAFKSAKLTNSENTDIFIKIIQKNDGWEKDLKIIKA